MNYLVDDKKTLVRVSGIFWLMFSFVYDEMLAVQKNSIRHRPYFLKFYQCAWQGCHVAGTVGCLALSQTLDQIISQGIYSMHLASSFSSRQTDF